MEGKRPASTPPSRADALATVSLALGIAAVCCVLSLLGRGLLAFLLPWPWPLRLAVVGWVTGWFALGTGAASGRRRG